MPLNVIALSWIINLIVIMLIVYGIIVFVNNIHVQQLKILLCVS